MSWLSASFIKISLKLNELCLGRVQILAYSKADLGQFQTGPRLYTCPNYLQVSLYLIKNKQTKPSPAQGQICAFSALNGK